ncbi:MAG: hypothetical protein ABI538_03380 [Pseudoxanthomonas sp.]
MNASRSLVIALLATLPLVAQATSSAPSETRTEIKREMADARQEVRVEMAKARAELDSENLSLDKGLHFGKNGKRESANGKSLPAAQISPKGDFLVDGKAVTLSALQRQQLLDYREQVIELAKAGINGGEQAAMAALDATDVSLFRLIAGGISGSLERRVQASVKQRIQPVLQQICRGLPQLLESQQQLTASLPQFQPYATLEADDIADCEREVRSEFATR